MMFASKTPRDLNHDKHPYIEIETKRRYASAPSGTDYYFRHNPRPEFDHVQHNEPNPILVVFRNTLPLVLHGVTASWLARHWTCTDEMWENMVLRDNSLDEHIGTPEHEDHARKVLTLLAAQEALS